MSEMTFEEVEKLCCLIKDQRDVLDDFSDKKKVENEKLEKLEGELLEKLHALGKNKYDSQVGVFYISHKAAVKMPSDPSRKREFFQYLKERGHFEDLVTINYNTLNGFYKSEWDEAKRVGNIDFCIPGVESPTITEMICFRQEKK